MRAGIVSRWVCTTSFAFLGCIAGIVVAPLLSVMRPLPGGCMMGQMMYAIFGGCLLASLLGCAVATPKRGVALRRRILSFILAPAVAILGTVALYPSLDKIPAGYEPLSLLLFFVIFLPTLSLFGFSIPLLLSREKTPLIAARTGPAS